MARAFGLAQKFPPDTNVRVYDEGAWGAHELPPAGEPPKGARLVARSKVHQDGAKFGSSVKDGRTYYAYAEVDGEHRYVRFVG